MSGFRCLAAAAASFLIAMPVSAQSREWAAAEGRAFLVAPDHWTPGNEPGFDLYLEFDSDHGGGITTAGRCKVQLLKTQYPREVSSQQALNQIIALKKSTDLVKPPNELHYFSNTSFSGSSRVLAFGFSEPGPFVMRYDIRQAYISEGESTAVIQADCWTSAPRELNPGLKKEVEDFLGSMRIAPR